MHRDGKEGQRCRMMARKFVTLQRTRVVYQHVQSFGLNDELCRGVAEARSSHIATTTNCLLKSYMKDNHAPRAHKMLHYACTVSPTTDTDIYEMVAVRPARPTGLETSEAKDPRTLPVDL